MSRLVKIALRCVALSACAALVAACGTQKLSTPRATSNAHYGAVLFAQRCSGCHTLSYAGTHGSAANVRTAMQNNGPNFNVRCERPITRVLYAIQNGGFSGAIMPQNIVVGADARAVAQFVSQYAGRQSPKIVGLIPCGAQQIGVLPTAGQTTATSTSSSSSAVAVPGTQVKAGPHSATSQGTHKTTRTK